MTRRSIALGLTVLIAAGAVRAQTTVPAATEPATLKVGDPAPPLTPGAWLLGTPVNKLEHGKIYVVEFWATWCAPCREAMPYLTELAKKHPDVTFIGQNVMEEDDSVVKPFVDGNATNMQYHVAADDKTKEPDGAMLNGWLSAAGINSIPTTFLIDKQGQIAWIGNPVELDDVLDQVLAGTYDVKAVAAKEKKVPALLEQADRAAATHDMDAMLKADKELVALDAGYGEPVLAFELTNLLHNGKSDDARNRAETLVSTSKNPVRLNGVAWQLATQAAPDARDLKIARTATDRAFDLTDHKEPAIFDTSARIYAVGKDWDKAVDQQQKAVALTDGELKSAMQKVLDAYQQHQLPADE